MANIKNRNPDGKRDDLVGKRHKQLKKINKQMPSCRACALGYESKENDNRNEGFENKHFCNYSTRENRKNCQWQNFQHSLLFHKIRVEKRKIQF